MPSFGCVVNDKLQKFFILGKKLTSHYFIKGCLYIFPKEKQEQMIFSVVEQKLNLLNMYFVSQRFLIFAFGNCLKHLLQLFRNLLKLMLVAIGDCMFFLFYSAVEHALEY